MRILGAVRASLAVHGTALIGLGLLATTWLRDEPGPVAARVVRLEGPGVTAGWYEADDLGAAVRAAGGEAPLLASADVGDGDTVRLLGGWAMPLRDVVPVEAVALGRRLGLNGATAAELESLPGIGPTLAARIVAGRPYHHVDDLDRVKGIGPKKLHALRALVQP